MNKEEGKLRKCTICTLSLGMLFNLLAHKAIRVAKIDTRQTNIFK